MNNEIRDVVTGMCQDLGIPVVGFAPAGSWDNPPFEPWVPEEFRPRAIYPETKTVIVIGLPVSLPILETAPSIHYHELYRTVNTLLDMHGYTIAEALTRRGYPSVWIPRDGYGSIAILKEKPIAFFSHRHAAYLAGLGTFGINNTLLTMEFGPRIRFASVFTSAEISPDKVLEKDLCIRCMRCVDSCPVKALSGDPYPIGLTEKKTCAARSEALANRFISPCGLCIKVCPVGADRKVFGREDPDIYHEDDGRFSAYHKAWKHVRSYGGR
ncbi:MAG: 4Fe-4S binding protein [Methanoregula sp.]